MNDVYVGETFFVAQTATAGRYGSFTLGTDGVWSYVADSSQTEIQSLGAGDTLTDSFTVTTAGGDTETVTVTITGTDDAAVIGGTTTGAVTEDSAVIDGALTASGTLTVSDTDAGEAMFVAQAATTGSYGSFSLGTDGVWSYSADNSQAAVQSLGAGETLTDSFTVTTAGGDTETVTLTITGTDDATVIGGTTTGAVTEDTAVTDGDLTASGTLTVSDADAGEAVFVAQSGTAGSYGSFSLGTDGVWSYSADNSQAAVQSLGAGETLTDSFTLTTAGGDTETVTLTITGTDDAAVVGGTTTGAVTEDAAVTDGALTASGTLTVSDADTGEAVFVTQSGTAGSYGSFTLGTDGVWSYSADNSQAAVQSLGAGETLTDSFTVTTAGGDTETVTLTITGTDDAAVIGGTTTGAVTEDAAVTDGALTASGTLTVSDADAGEAVFVAQSGTAGSYGSFTLGTDGVWSYSADNSQAAVQSLGAGDALTDSFTVTTAGGDTETVTVTITGTDDAAVIGGTATGAVTEDSSVTDGDLTASGTLTLSDADAGEAEFVAQNSSTGSYGSFTLGTDGVWSYSADNSQAAVQSLGAGETLTDSFTVTTAGGDTETVTVTITGTDDAAVIGGTTTGAVTEDTAVTDGDLMASGTLTVSDADTGEAVFVAQSGTAGSYGSFSLGTDGVWSYAADNSLAAVQSLGAGETLTDSFTVTTAGGDTETVTVTITGTDDAAVIGGTTTGAVTEDAAVTDGDLTASGTLTVSDVDSGEAVFVAQSGTAGSYGSFTLGTDGVWSYAADNSQAAVQSLGAGETLTDSFTVTTAGGDTETVTLTITGTDDAAVIGGTTTGAVTEDSAVTDGDLTASGMLTVSDVDSGEAVFVAQSGTTGSYGSFTLGTDGVWSYAADNSQAAVQSLGAGETLTDSFTVTTAGGDTETVTLTITGTDDAAVIAGNRTGSVTEDSAVTNGMLTTGGTLTVSDTDTGEAV
ncbi:beta strand repeat-containing protein, partial [Salipiger marinus]|uniref:beta strand repeat-containing protein n=1 Tax=Salipiger marinus TaxID=555512 RepID=UPI001A96834A